MAVYDDNYILSTEITGSHSTSDRAFSAWIGAATPGTAGATLAWGRTYNGFFSENICGHTTESIYAGNIVAYVGYMTGTANPFSIDVTSLTYNKNIYNCSSSTVLSAYDEGYYCHFINGERIGLAVNPFVIFEPYDSAAESFLPVLSDLIYGTYDNNQPSNDYYCYLSVTVDAGAFDWNPTIPSNLYNNVSSVGATIDTDYGAADCYNFAQMINDSSNGAGPFNVGCMWSTSSDWPGCAISDYKDDFWGPGSIQNPVFVFACDTNANYSGWIPIHLDISTQTNSIYILIKSTVAVYLTPTSGGQATSFAAAFAEHSGSLFGGTVRGEQAADNPLPQWYIFWEKYGPIIRIYIPSSVNALYSTYGTKYAYLLATDIEYSTISITYTKPSGTNYLVLPSTYTITTSATSGGVFGSIYNMSYSNNTNSITADCPIEISRWISRTNNAESATLSITNEVYSSNENINISLTKYLGYNIYLYDWTGNIIHRDGTSYCTITNGATPRGYGEYVRSGTDLHMYVTYNSDSSIYVSQGDNIHIFLREVLENEDESTFVDFPCGTIYLDSKPSNIDVTINEYTIDNQTEPDSTNNIYYSDFYTTDSNGFHNGNGYTSTVHSLDISVGNISNIDPGEQIGYIVISTGQLYGKYHIPIYKVNVLPLTGVSLNYGVSNASTNIDPSTSASSTNSIAAGPIPIYLHLLTVPSPPGATEKAAKMTVQYSNGAGGTAKSNADTTIGKEECLCITSGGTVTVTYTYYLNGSSSSSSSSYTFTIPKVTAGNGDFYFTTDPGPDVNVNATNDYFVVKWDGSEEWSSSASANDPGYLHFDMPNGCTITDKSKVSGSSRQIRITYTASSYEQTGVTVTAYLRTYNGVDVSVGSRSFNINALIKEVTIKRYSSYTGSNTVSGWSTTTATDSNTRNISNISGIIWYDATSSAYSLGYFDATCDPSNKVGDLTFSCDSSTFVYTSTYGNSGRYYIYTKSNDRSIYNPDHTSTVVSFTGNGHTAGYQFTACQYTTSISSDSDSYSATSGGYVDVIIYYNGDEYYSNNEISFSRSTTTSSLIDISSTSILNDSWADPRMQYSYPQNGYVTYRVQTKSVQTSGTGYFTVSCTGKGSTQPSITVPIRVSVPEAYYQVTINVDSGYKSTVYGIESTRLKIQGGSYVNTATLNIPTGLEYSTDNSNWSSAGNVALTEMSNATKYIYVRNITSGVYTKTITLTAGQRDTGISGGSVDSDTCDVVFGQISYSVNTYNGNTARTTTKKDTVYIGDKIEFVVDFDPVYIANPSSGSGLWNNISNSLSSPETIYFSDSYILSGIVSDTSPSATFYYSSDDGNNHTFSFDTVRYRSVDTDALKVPGGTLVIKGIHTTPPTLRDSSIDIPISGTTIVSINDASFVGRTGQDANLSKATDASLSLWINDTTLWSSVEDAPDSTAGYTYTIVLTGTNDLDDTVVNNSAGTLHWKIGRDNFVFSSDPSTASVVGSANKTATFNVVCSYKDNEVIHYCQDVSIASNSGSAWCNASIVNNETSYTVTITTTAKNYTLNNKTATIVLSTKWDESQGEAETINIIFIQEPLLVGVTFNLSIKNDSDNNTIINSNTKSLSTTYKTRGSYSKEYTIECIREERETINDASAEVTVSCKLATGSTANNVNGFSRSIMSPGNGQSDYFRITSSDNSGDDGQDRSAQYILITNHQGSNTLETNELAANYNVTYQVTVSQEGCRYSNFTLKINGETTSSVDFGKSSRAGTNVEIPIVCTYIKTVDNTTETKQGQWYPIYDSLPAWLTSIDPASNTNVSDRNLKFTVINNADTESRDYTLSINTSFNGYGSAVTRTLHIIQSGTSTEFVPSTKTVDASTTSFTVDITSDDSWALVGYENRPSWITSITPIANDVPSVDSSVYDSSVNVVLAEHFSLTAANDYVKYRTTTTDRTATITAESSSNVNTSLGITQQGYSWSKTCNYPPVINLTSGQVKFTFTVASNYQIKLTGTERLTIPAEGIPGPSFNSTDGAEVVNSLTYDVSIKCNASASPKESIITILQDRIADEDDLNTSGSAYYQSNIITVKQPAASYTRYGSLQIIHDSNVVTPLENNDYGKVEFASAGNGATQIITVRSELGGWYLDSSSEAYLNSPESWITFRKNGEDVRGDRGFEENDSSAFKNVDIAIKCNTWNDVHNDRSVYLTFVHDVSSNIIAKLQVFQKKSDVQFALVASNDASLNGSTDLKDIILLLKERKINDPITSGYLLSAPIENEAVSLSYYLYYYIGGADKEDISQPITDIFKKVYENYVSIKSQFPSDCISAIEWTILSPEGNINPLDPTNYANGYWPAIPPECDWSDFNSTRVANINSEKIYKINLRIAKNENVYEKLHELKINSEANSSLEVKIQLLQPGETYSADFTFIDPTTIGEWSSRQNAYIIPVYGGSYPITVRNKLRYDTISIVNIYIDDNNTTTNIDESDFSDWASFKYLDSNGDYQDFDPNNPVILKEDVQGEDTANQQFMIVINPYTKKEGEETANDISNDRNKKLYRVYFVATSSSEPTTEITKVVTNSTATMEIVGVQESMDLRKTTWKLIADETRQDERTGSFKIFARTDITDGQNRILYSNDTGYTLINYNGSKVVENIAAEEDVIKNMFEGTLLEDTRAALDERIGVRIYGNN